MTSLCIPKVSICARSLGQVAPVTSFQERVKPCDKNETSTVSSVKKHPQKKTLKLLSLSPITSRCCAG